MDRIISIINLLKNYKGFITVEELAKEFGVTARTIRSDLIEIEAILSDYNIKLIRKRNLGISFDNLTTNELMISKMIKDISTQKDFYSPKQRQEIITQMLLFEEGNITIENLVDLTLSSKSTVVKDLEICERFLEEYDITVIKTPKVGIRLAYSEYNWRMAVLNHVHHCLEDVDFNLLYLWIIKGEINLESFIPNEYIQNIAHSINVSFVSKFIRFFEKENDINFTEKSFISIYFYIAISVFRINQNRVINEKLINTDSDLIKNYLEKLIERSFNFFDEDFKRIFNKDELQALLYYMFSSKQIFENDALMDAVINNETFENLAYDLSIQFIEYMEGSLGVSLMDDKMLISNIVYHMRPAIFRFIFSTKIENPLTEQLKETYPSIFKSSQNALKTIFKDLGGSISEDDVGFLVLHIAAILEQLKNKDTKTKYRCFVVCPDGKGTSFILYQRLINEIPNLQINGVYSLTEFAKIKIEETDLIISTVPYFINRYSHVVIVNPLLNKNDIARIQREIKKIQIKKTEASNFLVDDLMEIVLKYSSVHNYQDLFEAISSYFDRPVLLNQMQSDSILKYLIPSLVNLKLEVSTWKEAFKQAGELLLNQNYIEDKYITAMIKNAEDFGAYMILYDQVAMPHAKTTDGVIKTGMSFVTLANPVEFIDDGEIYQLSFIIVLASNHSNSHLRALNELISVISVEANLQHLLSLEDTDEFIACFKDHLSQAK